MNKKFTAFAARLKTMLKVDFYRLFTTPLVYVMFGIGFFLPILILVMTTLVGEGGAMFTNVWQAIGSAGGSAMSMDLTSMCNINLLYFLAAVFVCLFVGDDFRSGYCKNLFTVRAQKSDYVAAKTVVCFAASAGMVALYFVGAMIGGKIAGLSFSLAEAGAGAGNIVCCLLAKLFAALIFVAIAVLLSAVGKQRTWLSVLGSLAAGALLFTMLPLMSPLDAGVLHAGMCLAGGALFAAGLGAVSCVILNRTGLA